MLVLPLTQFRRPLPHPAPPTLLALLVGAMTLGLFACNVQAPVQRERALVALGQTLFADASLSSDGTVACQTCHLPSRLFTDGKEVSQGVGREAGTRNALSLTDIHLAKTFFWDGREERLEAAVLQPFTNKVEMGLPDLPALQARISAKPSYDPLLVNAFGNTEVRPERLAEALAAFLRSIPAAPTRYERSLTDAGTPMNDAERQGHALFVGKAACADCHRVDGVPANFTDDKFHHAGIGFQRVAGNLHQMIARLDEIKKRNQPIGQVILSDGEVAELGRFATTRKPEDLGAFRTPSLRNVALTAPYMHDGSVPTLELALERELYYRGLARGTPISLTLDEQRQLLAFLRALNTQ